MLGSQRRLVIWVLALVLVVFLSWSALFTDAPHRFSSSFPTFKPGEPLLVDPDAPSRAPGSSSSSNNVNQDGTRPASPPVDDLNAVPVRPPKQGASNAPSQFEWSSTSTLFSFGDSYTSTWFSLDGEVQPSLPLHPLGNRDREPDGKVYDGPKWMEQLTTQFNTSRFLTYNLAVGGATVSRKVVPIPSWGSSVTTGDEQLVQWLKYYAAAAAEGDRSRPTWDPSTTLFTFFFGINDINISYLMGRHTPVEEVIAEYRKMLATLRKHGARHFLVLNVPPIEQLHDKKDSMTKQETEDVKDYNNALRQMMKSFASSQPGLKAWYFDTHALWSDMIAKPSSFKKYEETQRLRVTEGWCDEYAPGTPGATLEEPQLHYNAKKCKGAIDEYMWQNSLHATWVPQTLTARFVSEGCFGHEEEAQQYCYDLSSHMVSD